MTFCYKPQLKEYAKIIAISIQNSCRCPQACDQVPISIPILGISSLNTRKVKRNRTSPLSNISVMCKERSESVKKYLRATYMYNLQSRSFVLPNAFDVYFVTSKFGLLIVNDFCLINFILLNASLKFLNIHLMLQTQLLNC